ncbi:hypothetical protein F442_10296 [Phytophthora nicotianae P10297]|uniref:DUF1764 domain-containing protein n=2 Tax=Phytophthora nicotianae TaxID=4792 RepID=W2Z6Z2_PHYNI|nr:hypothetical protein L917_09990 [Phytophthora nicotianae]ETP42830.1 hypothetical protein F442_10296 [Phytophthora nicotianae P10297]
MANKKKRSRVQAASAPVPSEQKPKKKAKFAFSKTLSTDAKIKAAVADDSKPQETKEQSVVKQVAEFPSTDGAKKKKKKKKNKNAGAATTNDAAKTEKPTANSGEIDDLFASLKTEKQKKSIAEQQQKLAEEEEERREKKEKERLQQQIKKLEAQNTNSTAVGLNPDPRPVRYDEDGLPIYTEASLQIGKGGNTKDCPFDCWCCF